MLKLFVFILELFLHLTSQHWPYNLRISDLPMVIEGLLSLGGL